MAKYKFKLSEMSKTASPDDAEKELGTPKRKFEVGQVTYSDDGTTSSKITNIDPVTGAVSWKITQLPGFEKLYKEMDDLVDVSKRVYVKTKEDKKFREFYENARKLRNSIRTHLRNEYPDQYKRITRIGEGDMDEVSMSGAAGAYLTPYAFRRKGQKADDEAYKELGYKPVKENFSAGGRSLGYYEEDDVNEEIKLNILPKNNIAILKGDSGEYEGFIEDGEVSFSTIYDDLDYRITDEYDESNIEDFLGRGHAFVELAKKYDYNWNIEPDLVGITIKLKDKLKEAFDELDDGFDPEMEALIKSGPRLNKDRFKDVIYYIHNNWMAGNYGDDYAIRRISKYLNALEENIDPKSQKKHKGKAAPYGSAYQKVEEVEWVDESLRDWFKKEDWVRINTSGNITGPCGTMKKGKATTRCLPRKKAQSLTKAERKATVAKKVRGSKKGKQFVKNTSKAKFKKK